MSVSSEINFLLAKSIDLPYVFLLHFKESGWSYRNGDLVDYLPIGDIDDFDWQQKSLTEDELKIIIEKKWSDKEQIGITIWHQKSSCGGEIMIKHDGYIQFLPSRYRRELPDGIGFTDISWYLLELIPILLNFGLQIEAVHWSEHV